MTVVPGGRLGAYEIVGLLGAGGMGEVYKATDTRLRRSVAVKLLPAAHGAEPDRLRRFEQEALAAAALSHPNILAGISCCPIQQASIQLCPTSSSRPMARTATAISRA